MVRFFVPFTLIALYCAPLPAADSAAGVASELHRITLDPRECYRVIDLNLSKGDARLYFTSGYLIFANPIKGRRLGAFFTSDVEGGDGELLVLPPVRSERLSLTNFTGSPNLDEHFRSAALLFSDDTAAGLLAKIHENPIDKPAPEMGALLLDKTGTVLANLAGSFEVRLVEDLLSNDRRPGLFYMAVGGAKLGNFDLVRDAATPEQMLVVGQLAYRHDQPFFDVWTSFAEKASHKAGPPPPNDVTVDNYRIDVRIDPDLTLKATTRLTLKSSRPLSRVIPFFISRQMRVSEVTVDGRPAEVFQKESLRSNLISSTGNEEFLVVAAKPLEAGTPHEFVFQHDGAVIAKAAEGVYFVGARGAWYPRRTLDFAHYDLTFRYPKALRLVASGDSVEESTEGDLKITRRRSAAPLRFVGFNLGEYESARVDRGPYRIEVFANRKLEPALRQRPMPPLVPVQPSYGTRRRPDLSEQPPPQFTPNPAARLTEMAGDVANAFEFMANEFGPPPTKTLTVSPIPGNFGQGFTGLVYLSTLSYLDPAQRPAAVHNKFEQTFFSDVLEAHEVAHQWWGNLVVAAGYQDNWLLESLANYSALLYLEKKKGARAIYPILEAYRNHLLAKAPNGKSLESAGPLTWGYRLESSQAPSAFHVITYEKGTWVLHMLRKRIGDAPFQKMLREMCERFQFQPLGTEEFRQVASRYLPARSVDPDLTGFFDTWVYGTGIPALKLSYSMRGLRLSGTVSQSDVRWRL